jgi:hypothetical protein
MRLRRLIITVALLSPTVVAGQSLRSANVVAIPAGVVRTTDKAAVSQQLPPMSWQSAFGDSVVARRSGTRRGAIIGAIVGGVIGGVGGAQLNFGCSVTSDSCNARAEEIKAEVTLAAVGALLGAGVGALIGRLSSGR